jgi:hypothetical protein
VRQSDRIAVQRRIAAAEIELARRTAEAIVKVLAEAARNASPSERAAISRGMGEFRHRAGLDTNIVDLPRLLLDAVHRHAPAVAEKTAKAVGIEITNVSVTGVQPAAISRRFSGGKAAVRDCDLN